MHKTRAMMGLSKIYAYKLKAIIFNLVFMFSAYD